MSLLPLNSAPELAPNPAGSRTAWASAALTVALSGVALWLGVSAWQHRWLEAMAGGATGASLAFVWRAQGRAEASRQRLLAREADLRAMAHALPDLAFMLDKEGRYLDVFGNNEALLVRPKHELLGRKAADFFSRDAAQAFRAVLDKALTTGQTQSLSYPVKVRGRVHHFDSRCAPVTGQDRVVWVIWDVTAQRRAEERVRLNSAALESSRDGMMVLDRGRLVVSINTAFSAITGYEESEVVGRSVEFLFPSDADAQLTDMIDSLRRHAGWDGEAWCQRKDGEPFSSKVSVSAVGSDRGLPSHFVAVFTDITALKLSEARLARLAHFDPLTELPNRSMILDRLVHAVSLAKRHHTLVGVLFIDLDNFKTVNDSQGHAAGDVLLQQVAQRLRLRVRQEDTLGRLGGDEFVLVLEHLRHPQQAAHVAQAVIDTLADPMLLPGGREVYVRASIGISLYPNDCQEVGELIRNADTAMYQAKRMGRNTFRFYTESLTSQATARLSLETRLRRAVEHHEFMLHFQPMVCMATGRVEAVEALVRLRVPETTNHCLPSIGPDEFIPVMEDTGMIVALGEWVLLEACTHGRRWLDAGLDFGRIAVNVSASEIRRGGLIEQVSRVLQATGLPPERLELEITESGLMEHGGHAEAFLHQLHALGVSLAIDDFGTGYSSLAYLKRFPVQQLKIDRSFVRDLPHQESDAQLVRTMITLAHNLKLRVVAEGVERADQSEFLRAQGCDTVQGYHHGRPVAASELEALLPRLACAKA